jgi:hypothetical protein
LGNVTAVARVAHLNQVSVITLVSTEVGLALPSALAESTERGSSTIVIECRDVSELPDSMLRHLLADYPQWAPGAPRLIVLDPPDHSVVPLRAAGISVGTTTGLPLIEVPSASHFLRS